MRERRGGPGVEDVKLGGGGSQLGFRLAPEVIGDGGLFTGGQPAQLSGEAGGDWHGAKLVT